MRSVFSKLNMLLCLLGVLSLSGNSMGQSLINTNDRAAAEPLFSWVTSYGMSFGGGDAVRSQYDPYRDSIEVTGLASLSAGGDYRFKRSPFSVQALVSVYFDNTDANKGDANFDYHTVDLLSFYSAGRHRYGLGITRHLNPRFATKYTSGNQPAHFEDTFGAMAEYNYQLHKKTAVGLRFTHIKYQPLNNSGKTVDGKNIGFFIKTFF